MKKYLWIAAGGGLVGGMFTSWLAPKMIAWYFNPPIEMAINCNAPIQWALIRLQWAQLIGTVSGAVLFSILYFAFFRPRQSATDPTV